MGSCSYRTSLCWRCTLLIKDYSPVTRYSRTVRASTIGYGSFAGQSWCEPPPYGIKTVRRRPRVGVGRGLAVATQKLLAHRFMRQDFLGSESL